MKKILTKLGNGGKGSKPVVSFNEEHQAIEICGDHCHFLLNPNPSMKGTFGTAQWAVGKSSGWKLPSESEIDMVKDYLDEINETLLANDFPPICDDERWWVDEYHISTSLLEVSWAKNCPLAWHHLSKSKIDDPCEFRLVKPLQS